MSQYQIIVILGPDIPGPGIDERAKLEALGVKFIGDGISPVDYRASIQELSNQKLIGPNTKILINAHGNVRDGTHYMSLGPQDFFAPNGGASESVQVLQDLKEDIQAYDDPSAPAETEWLGSVVISSCFSGQLLKDINQPGGWTGIKKIAVSSDGDTVSLAPVSFDDIYSLLKSGDNLYWHIADELSRTLNRWAYVGPDGFVEFRRAELAKDHRGNPAFKVLREHQRYLQKELENTELSEAKRAALMQARAEVAVALKEVPFVRLAIGSAKWWVGVVDMIREHESSARGTGKDIAYPPEAMKFFQSVPDVMKAKNLMLNHSWLQYAFRSSMKAAELMLGHLDRKLTKAEGEDFLQALIKTAIETPGDIESFKACLRYLQTEEVDLLARSSDGRAIVWKVLQQGNVSLLRAMVEVEPERMLFALFGENQKIFENGSLFSWANEFHSLRGGALSEGVFEFVPGYLSAYPFAKERLLKDIFLSLVEREINTDFRNSPKLPLMLLAAEDRRYLLNDLRTSDGATLLELVIKNGDFLFIEQLLGMGADIGAVGRDGKSAYDLLRAKPRPSANLLESLANGVGVGEDNPASLIRMLSLAKSNETYRQILVDRLREVPLDVFHTATWEGKTFIAEAISYTLGAHVEKLLLTGGDINGTGNSTGSSLTGSAGHNTLTGGAGDDTFRGGRGNDTLIGGNGNDNYFFERGDRIDIVDDSGGNEKLSFGLSGGGRIDYNQLWFERESGPGGNLKISVMGGHDAITIQNWYLASFPQDGGGRMETIEAASSEGVAAHLVSADVQRLVDAMAGMTPPSSATSWAGLSSTQQNQLQSPGGVALSG
jgi:hypothetical protein